MNLVEISSLVFKIREVEIGKILVCVNNTLVLHTTFLAARHTTMCLNILRNHVISCVCFICDQICQKGSYARTVSGLIFHSHSTDTTIDQQFMLVPLPKLQRFAFTKASFTGLYSVHGCSVGL